MQQTHALTTQATETSTDTSRDASHAIDHGDVFEAAIAELRNAGIGFVVVTEGEPMERAA